MKTTDPHVHPRALSSGIPSGIAHFIGVAGLVVGLSGCYALSRGDENPCREAAALVMEREDLRQDLDAQQDYYRRREVLVKLNRLQRELDRADAACENYREEQAAKDA